MLRLYTEKWFYRFEEMKSSSEWRGDREDGLKLGGLSTDCGKFRNLSTGKFGNPSGRTLIDELKSHEGENSKDDSRRIKG